MTPFMHGPRAELHWFSVAGAGAVVTTNYRTWARQLRDICCDNVIWLIWSRGTWASKPLKCYVKFLPLPQFVFCPYFKFWPIFSA